jgi:putative hydrolase of the HAD superfamily
MAARPIKAVFFDAGGTLIAPRLSFSEIYSRVLVPLGISAAAGDFQEAALETWAEFDALVGSGRDRYSHFEGGEREYWRRFVRRVLEHLSQAEKAEEAAEALNETFSDPGVWSVFPEVRPTLHALHERGVRLGIISNWDSRLRRILSGLGLEEEFETIVVSCEVGAEKPAAAIFARALENLGLDEPSQALHVGDDARSDYEGARAAGIEPVLLVRDGEPPSDLRAVKSLDALLSFIPGLDGSSGDGGS